MLIMNILTELMTLTQNYKFSKFGPKTEMYSDFYEIWDSKQIELAYYEYNIRKCLERSHDYRLRMIIGCQIRLTVRT